MLFQTYENRFVLYVRGYAGKDELTRLCEDVAGAMEALFAAERIGGGIGVLEIGEQDTGKDADLLLRRLLIASERSLSLSDRDFQTCFYDAALEELIDRETPSGRRWSTSRLMNQTMIFTCSTSRSWI